MYSRMTITLVSLSFGVYPRRIAHATCLDVLHIHRQSAYLFGRDRTVVDVVLEHPSCSKQHAVIQCTPSLFRAQDVTHSQLAVRHIQEKNEFGEVKATVK